MNVGVGSRVERAGPPVSPRGSAPRPLDFRRGRDMVSLEGMKYNRSRSPGRNPSRSPSRSVGSVCVSMAL